MNLGSYAKVIEALDIRLEQTYVGVLSAMHSIDGWKTAWKGDGLETSLPSMQEIVEANKDRFTKSWVFGRGMARVA